MGLKTKNIKKTFIILYISITDFTISRAWYHHFQPTYFPFSAKHNYFSYFVFKFELKKSKPTINGTSLNPELTSIVCDESCKLSVWTVPNLSGIGEKANKEKLKKRCQYSAVAPIGFGWSLSQYGAQRIKAFWRRVFAYQMAFLS